MFLLQLKPFSFNKAMCIGMCYRSDQLTLFWVMFTADQIIMILQFYPSLCIILNYIVFIGAIYLKKSACSLRYTNDKQSIMLYYDNLL
jgi:hypothetical protein